MDKNGDLNNKKGSEHPLMMLVNQAYKVFTDLNFEIVKGPELEDEWYNFDSLNVPKDHPARDMQDTFIIKDRPGFVLRTHTTSATARALEKVVKEGRSLPYACVSLGKTFRNESTDAMHEAQFHQIDGAIVGENVTLAQLKGVLEKFYKEMLGKDVELEFRASFFPFVEPGIEVWVKFNNKWLEVMGAGMLHPNVIKNLGFDPLKVQGFAFGGGFDRIAIVKWNITDIRFLYQGDLRLNQF